MRQGGREGGRGMKSVRARCAHSIPGIASEGDGVLKAHLIFAPVFLTHACLHACLYASSSSLLP